MFDKTSIPTLSDDDPNDELIPFEYGKLLPESIIIRALQTLEAYYQHAGDEFEIQIMFTMPSLSVESELSNKQRKLKELKNRS
ncbi:hypothetical protein CPB84DRAFT_1853469 [Gymnopilus junonius]|uniref:Uncharacterized protein n=1 Tax=Gymnopilus junonius TaxID=109634 RepID=A0A9P5NBJ2_GYMJU|nr:hypothetical protein CPB84DRAFT_1853469 [Gymnopilus junonius]